MGGEGDDAEYVPSVKKSLGLEGTADKSGGWLGSALKRFFG
jgi:hypothetical protein